MTLTEKEKAKEWLPEWMAEWDRLMIDWILFDCQQEPVFLTANLLEKPHSNCRGMSTALNKVWSPTDRFLHSKTQPFFTLLSQNSSLFQCSGELEKSDCLRQGYRDSAAQCCSAKAIVVTCWHWHCTTRKWAGRKGKGWNAQLQHLKHCSLLNFDWLIDYQINKKNY